MSASNVQEARGDESEVIPTKDCLEIAMARFGYAVSGLGEKDLMAVVELVERLTGEVKRGDQSD